MTKEPSAIERDGLVERRCGALVIFDVSRSTGLIDDAGAVLEFSLP